MSVIVKGMEMPGSCTTCKIGRRYGCAGDVYCNYLHEYFTGNTNPPYKERPDECPLEEVPTPHGRLIDENGVLAALRSKAFDLASGDAGEYRALMWAIKQIESAPTIIEAEGET